MVEDTDEEETIVIRRTEAFPETTPPAAKAVQIPENNLWKTAFIVLAGVVLLGSGFIYLTSGKQTNPATQLQTDANGMPVQPAPPPSGTMEQTLANMDSYNPQMYSNSETGVIPEGGGVSNPYWESGKTPPGMPGGSGGYYDQPYPVQPGSQTGPTVYMDSNTGSVFMPQLDGTYVEMRPKTSSNSAVNVSNSKKNLNSNTAAGQANTAPKTTATPAGSKTPEAKPTQTPKANPPTETKPKTEPKSEQPNKPSATDKRPVSGKEQDTKQ